MSAPESSTTTNAASKRPREDNTEAGRPTKTTEAERSTQAKRARAGTKEPVRDGEFWYEDGSIILEARDVQFRVYQGVLADHSSVFADMFSLPQPPSPATEAAIPNCPVVRLEDSPEDLRHILRALFPRKQASFISVEPTKASFHVISAYARLGHKYQMDGLLNQALDFLKRHFSSDFDTWYAHPIFVPDEWNDEHAIGVVNIARLVGCDSLLPTALSVCSVLFGQFLVAGFDREDGTKERLSEQDLMICITAISTLCQTTTGAVLEVLVPFDPQAGTCESTQSCRGGVRALLRSCSQAPDTIANAHPFIKWPSFLDEWLDSSPGTSLCAQCLESLQSQFLAKQRKLWSQLPELLGITVKGWSGEV